MGILIVACGANYASLEYFNAATNEWRYTPGEPVNFRLSFGVNLVHSKKDLLSKKC